MNRSDRRLLERLKAEARQIDIEPAVHRSYLRLRVELCAGLRVMLLSLGIDPAGVRCLGYGDKAAAELAAIPDTPELEQADDDLLAADEAQTPLSGTDPWDDLLAKIERGARYWAESGRTPDFSSEPLQTVLAWCLGQDPAAAAWAEPAGPEAAEQAVAAPHPIPHPAGGERESEAKPETGKGEDSSEADLGNGIGPMKPLGEIPLYLRCINSGAIFGALPSVGAPAPAEPASGAGGHAPAAVVACRRCRYPAAR